jgi:aminopeptidase N
MTGSMRYILLFSLFLSATSFAQTKTDSVSNVMLDTIVVKAAPGAPEYRAAATRVWDIRNTRIAVSFNWKEKTADMKEWIKLHPYFYATDSVELDAKSMRIDSVLLAVKKGNTVLRYSYANDKLVIHFGQQYKQTDTITLYLKYTAMPYASETGGGRAITDDRGLYFINADGSIPHKPTQAWTQGETEANSHWMVTIDKPNTRFTTQIELTVPDSFTTLSNGAMVKRMKGKNGLRTDIWRMDMPIQAYVAMFAVGKFSVVKDHWRGKEVNYYVEPQYAPYASLMFNYTPEMMEYFSTRTGVAFPWNKYSQVVVRDYVSGAMENTSAALFGEFLNQDAQEYADRNSEDVVSHELFHEWFGDYVTCESWSNITVNESFANYGEQLWQAHKHGKDAGDELGWDDLSIYIASAGFHDPQLVRYNYDSREEVFDAISYNKGGAILHYLNTMIGDAAFDRAMNIYLTKNALHSAEAQSWRMAVEEATGRDWNWFFNEWYYHAGHPKLKVTYDYNDTVKRLFVTVAQTQDDSTFIYQLPLKTAVLYNNERTIVDWDLKKRTDTFSFAYHGDVKPVIIPDCQHILPGEVRDTKKQTEWLAQYVHSDGYLDKRLAISTAGRMLSDSSSQVLITMALGDKSPLILKHTLSQLKNASNDKYKRKWAGMVEDIAKNDTDRQVRADAFDVLESWKTEKAKGTMFAALNSPSYLVASSALSAINAVDRDTTYAIAKRMLQGRPKTSPSNAIWLPIGKKGADEDISLYEEYAPYALGTKKFTMASTLDNYLKNVKSDDSYKRAVKVFATLVTTEEMKSYRSVLNGYFAQVAQREADNAKSSDKDEAARGAKRSAVVKTAMQSVVAAEHDPENLKDLQKKMKNLYE